MSKIFAEGAFWKEPRDNAPDFVIGSLGVKVHDFKKFLDANVKNNGYVDLDILKAKSGKPYVALNEYQLDPPSMPKEKTNIEYPTDEVDPNDVPF